MDMDPEEKTDPCPTCKGPDEGFQISCDNCGKWYHGKCVGQFKKKNSLWNCPLCTGFWTGVWSRPKKSARKSAAGALDSKTTLSTCTEYTTGVAEPSAEAVQIQTQGSVQCNSLVPEISAVGHEVKSTSPFKVTTSSDNAAPSVHKIQAQIDTPVQCTNLVKRKPFKFTASQIPVEHHEVAKSTSPFKVAPLQPNSGKQNSLLLGITDKLVRQSEGSACTPSKSTNGAPRPPLTENSTVPELAREVQPSTSLPTFDTAKPTNNRTTRSPKRVLFAEGNCTPINSTHGASNGPSKFDFSNNRPSPPVLGKENYTISKPLLVQSSSTATKPNFDKLNTLIKSNTTNSPTPAVLGIETVPKPSPSKFKFSSMTSTTTKPTFGAPNLSKQPDTTNGLSVFASKFLKPSPKKFAFPSSSSACTPPKVTHGAPSSPSKPNFSNNRPTFAGLAPKPSPRKSLVFGSSFCASTKAVPGALKTPLDTSVSVTNINSSNSSSSSISGSQLSNLKRSRLSLKHSQSGTPSLNSPVSRKLVSSGHGPTPVKISLISRKLVTSGDGPTPVKNSLISRKLVSSGDGPKSAKRGGDSDVSSDGSLSPDFKKPRKLNLAQAKLSSDLTQAKKASISPFSKGNLSKTSKRPVGNFECPNCHSIFKREDNFKRHQKACSSTSTKKRNKSKCLYDTCHKQFYHRNSLMEHLEREHSQKVVPVKSFLFNSEKDFIKWKDEEEVRTFSLFTKNCGDKKTTRYFYCQHDGSSRAHRSKSEHDRKTSRKVRIGQIKTGKTCISKIIATFSDSGAVEVKYYATHSHPLSLHDFAHHPPTSEKNEEINNKIACGVPAAKIWESLQSADYSRENRDKVKSNAALRTVVITLSAIKQRVAKQRQMLRYHKDDARSTFLLVEALKQEPYNPVLLYKPLGEKILVGPPDMHCLASEEEGLFMIALQTAEQRRIMVEGAKHILIADDTHCVTQYENFKLLSIHTLDANRRAAPVGHFLSSSMAGPVIRYFVEALRVRCDENATPLFINCLITDDDPALINGFELGMKMKIVHILCEWHLDRTFQDGIKDKVVKSLRDTVYIDLKVLILSKSKDEFVKLMSAFMKKYVSIADDFLNYMQKYYFNRPEKWAMSYRSELNHWNIETTSIAESFHNRLKKKRFPNKRVDDHCNQLLDIEKVDYIRRERETILGYSVSPQQNAERHSRGMLIDDSCISEINVTMWLFKSATKKDEFYHIDRMSEFCRLDHCFDRCINPSCQGLCSHLYFCSCADSVNLCKHIHKLHSYLMRGQVLPSYSNDNTSVVLETAPGEVCTEGTADFPAAAVPALDRKYSSLQNEVVKLSTRIDNKSIPPVLLDMCLETLCSVNRKCDVFCDQTLKPMPEGVKIAPRQKLRTQESQMLPFKRKKKRSQKHKPESAASKQATRNAAKNDLLQLCSVEDVEEIQNNDHIDESFSFDPLEPILSIGEFKISIIHLKSLELDLTDAEVMNLKSFLPNFQAGWLLSDVINSFLSILASTNDEVFFVASDCSLSLSRGNLLKRLFSHPMPKKSIFLFPCNLEGYHWTILSANAHSQKIIYFDPAKRRLTPQLLKFIDSVKVVMNVVKPDVHKWSVNYIDDHPQNDGINCGVHICWFGHQTIADEEYSSVTDVVQYRSFIHDTICGCCLDNVKKFDLPICSVCTVACGDDDVIFECCRCRRQHHVSCIKDWEEVICQPLQ